MTGLESKPLTVILAACGARQTNPFNVALCLTAQEEVGQLCGHCSLVNEPLKG